ncbi:hypothetical protein B0H13DRAFT_460479 [Mycena leptocephala]|nr:hypothetical protein B0H13DRAFT_460479 [Mycena leptocephala]
MKRSRCEKPSSVKFEDFNCTDDEALTSLQPALAWLCEGSQNTRADRVNYLEQLLFHKYDFDPEKARKFKKLRLTRLPSFQWRDLALTYHLGDNFQLLPKNCQDSFEVPECFLPFTLHRRVKCEGWIKMDVNGDVGLQNEAELVNIGQYAIEAVVSLFSGRIVNKSEASLPSTLHSSGGRVEFQLYTLGSILLVVAEFNQHTLTNDNAAQLFAEMISAAENNQAPCQRVHGMLSNMDYHHFFSYSPVTKKFTQGRAFSTAAIQRLQRLNLMVQVINYLFSICLDALLEYVLLSKKLSSTRRDQTHELLSQAQQQLQMQPDVEITVEEINMRGEIGLKLLQQGCVLIYVHLQKVKLILILM